MTAPTAPRPQAPRLDGAERRGLLVAVIAVVACLAPFLDKAFTVDDTLFLRLGRHVSQEPVDFYGFGVNWYHTTEPMSEITKNPPLMGYLLAGAAALVGWSEVALHGAALLSAVAVAVATFLLARRLCGRPLQATLLGLLTPVFLVSSSTVMCDTTMLACWCWALYLWVTGVDDSRPGALWLAGLAAGLGLLTKYFAVALLPLMLAYGLARRRRLGTWMLPLGLPLLMAAAYEGLTWHLYPDRDTPYGLLSDAVLFSGQVRDTMGGPDLLARTWVGLTFAGGCLITALFVAPLVFRRVQVLGGLALGVAVLAWMVTSGGPWDTGFAPADTGPGIPWNLALQAVAMALAGLVLVALTLLELRRPGDPGALLLVLWIGGTFVFATFLNWVNNGRSNLPMAPALGILVVRRLELLAATGRLVSRARLLVAGVPAVSLALLVALGDAAHAGSVRSAVDEIDERFLGPEAVPCLFQGHWGFQYYMEQRGAVAWDLGVPVSRGTLCVYAMPNVDFWLQDLDPRILETRADLRPPSRSVHTMAPDLEAAFYASSLGRLPFAFGTSTSERYLVLEALVDAVVVLPDGGSFALMPSELGETGSAPPDG